MAISLYEGSVASYLQTLAVQARMVGWLASVAPIASPCEGPLANIRAARTPPEDWGTSGAGPLDVLQPAFYAVRIGVVEA
jgi:hypothetical protein